MACAADFLFSVRSQPGTQPIVFISKRQSSCTCLISPRNSQQPGGTAGMRLSDPIRETRPGPQGSQVQLP